MGVELRLEKSGPWVLEATEGGCRVVFPEASGPESTRVSLQGSGGLVVEHGPLVGAAGYDIQILHPGCQIKGVDTSADRLVLSFSTGSASGYLPSANGNGSLDTDTYQIGIGDLIKFSVFGQEDLDREFRVTQEGTVDFPYLGDVMLAGHTMIAPRLVPIRVSRRWTALNGAGSGAGDGHRAPRLTCNVEPCTL